MASDTPKWTKEQCAGIETVDVNLLVSAAAGSGKTAVLAERCAYLVCDAPKPCEIDRLLVVTFTEAAASEMKGRIEAALRQRAAKDPENVRLRAQLAQIERAQVSTLHGFCARLLRRHFHLLELNPDFTVLDGDEASLLRAEVARKLLTDSYETDETGIFQKFVDVYGDGRDEDLQRHVIRTHELLCSVMDPDAWLAEARARIRDGATQPLRSCALGQELAAIVKQRLSALTERCDGAIALVNKMPGFAKYVEYLRNLRVEIAGWGRAFGDCDFDTLARMVQAFEPARKPGLKNDMPGKAAAEAALESVRSEMGKNGPLQPFICFSAKEWSHGLKTIEPFAGVFLGLVEEFRRRYRAAKHRARGIDFSDLERLALQVLRTHDSGKWRASDVARAYQRELVHVLVDEYQDINGVQEEILRLVSREGDPESTQNLFCVGDVKQSIYGFRLAEPARFLERYDRFKKDAQQGTVIDLQSNFRSRAPLLDALNALFERLMTREAADIDYEESQMLRPAANYPDSASNEFFRGAPIELHLLPRTAEFAEESEDGSNDLDRTEREASFIASRIHTMLGHDGSPRMQIIDRDAGSVGRPIAFRDIVILLRSMVYKAEQIAEVLRLHNIPVHRDRGTGYFNSTEVRDMLALLRLLDNAQQDIPLASVLRSPLSGLAVAEDSLARIRLAYRDPAAPIPFHEALARYAQEQHDELAAALRDFLQKFEKWRTTARLRPLAELIRQIYDDTGYLAFCSGLDNGEQRCANLLYLHDRAKQFGSFARQGLYRFLRFLDELQNESDVGLPSVLGEGENVVRIMSVHQAKGLEFPVVILPDLGKRINLRDCSGRVLVDRARFLGLPAIDEEKEVRYPSLASVLVSERLRQQAMAEELRVLYVAATRAREHLILVGTCDARLPERWDALYRSHIGSLPAQAVLSATCMLEWIGSAAAAIAGTGKPLFNLSMHSAEELSEWSLPPSGSQSLTPQQARYAALKPLDAAPAKNAVADAVIDRLLFKYPYSGMTERAATVAATTWAKGANDEPAIGTIGESAPVGASPLATLALPRAIIGEMELAATDRGTAAHLVLEHLDFKRSCTRDDVREQMAQMVRRKILSQRQADVVNLDAVAWFVQSEIGKLVRDAQLADVIREIPFNLAVVDDSISTAGGLDQVMLRGRIDLMVRQREGFVVIDYKTDDVTGEQIEQRGDSYRRQVQLYRDAIQKLTGVPVQAVYLAFLSPRVLRRI